MYILYYYQTRHVIPYNTRHMRRFLIGYVSFCLLCLDVPIKQTSRGRHESGIETVQRRTTVVRRRQVGRRRQQQRGRGDDSGRGTAGHAAAAATGVVVVDDNGRPSRVQRPARGSRGRGRRGRAHRVAKPGHVLARPGPVA